MAWRSIAPYPCLQVKSCCQFYAKYLCQIRCFYLKKNNFADIQNVFFQMVFWKYDKKFPIWSFPHAQGRILHPHNVICWSDCNAHMVPAYRMGYHCPIELLMLEHWLHSSPITHQGVLSNSLLPLLKSLPDLRSVRSCSNRFILIRLNRPRDLILSWMLFFTCLIHRNGFAPGYSWLKALINSLSPSVPKYLMWCYSGNAL